MIKVVAVFALIYLSLQILLPAATSSLQTIILPSIPDTDAFTITLDNGGLDNYGIDAFGAKRIMPFNYVATVSPDITYQVIFGYGCQVPATLHIASLGKFKAIVNGGLPMTGDDPNKKFTFTLSNLQCQNNILNITVT